MARIFLSYSRKEIFQALALKQWLIEQDPELQHEIFIDVDDIEAGTKWRAKLRLAISLCEYVVCLGSPTWQASTECQRELEEAEACNKRVIIAPLSEIKPRTKAEADWQWVPLYGKDAKSPRTVIEVEYDGHNQTVALASEGLQKLSRDVRRPGNGPETFDWPPANEPGRNPYRGLDSFAQIDAGVFFGRDDEVQQALSSISRLRRRGNGSYVIRGDRGVGKSSFLQAGLIPHLSRQYREFVVLGVVQAKRNPVTGHGGLTDVIRAAALRYELSTPNHAELQREFLNDPVTLDRYLARIHEAATRRLLLLDSGAEPPALVLAIDHSEQLFTPGNEAEQRLLGTLIDRFTHDGTATGVTVIPILTVSGDAPVTYEDTSAGSGVNISTFQLNPVAPQKFPEVIKGPAGRFNERHRTLDIDETLVDVLIKDFAVGANPLPVLSLTLAQLWRAFGSDDNLRHDEYIQLGKLGGPVSEQISETLGEMPGDRADNLELLRKTFVPNLATIDPDTGTAIARRAMPDELPPGSQDLIEQFIARRLLTQRSDGSIELAAHGILSGWRELGRWLDDVQAELEQAEALRRQSETWERSGRDKELLLDGRRLDTAEAILKSQFAGWVSPARAFVEVSRRKASRKRLVIRGLQAGAALGIVVALLLVVAFAQWRESSRIARALELVTHAEQMLDGSLPGGDVLAMQLLLAAHNLGVTNVEGVASQRNDLVRIMEVPSDNDGNVIGVNDIAISPDGSLIAAATMDHQVILWDTHTGRRTIPLELDGHGTMHAVAFSTTGDLIAAGGDDGKLRVWQTADGRPQPFSDVPGQMITSVAFSPTGRTVAAGTADGVLRLWDAKTGELRAEPKVVAEGKAVRSVAFNPDPKEVRNPAEPASGGPDDETDIVLTGDDFGRVQLWDGATAQPLSDPIVVDATSSVSSVAFGVRVNEHGAKYRLAAGMLDGRIHVLDARTLRPDGPAFAAHPGFVHKLAFSPGGTRIVSGGSDNSVRVWDAATHQPIGDPLLGHHGAVTSVAFDPEGTQIVSGAQDGSVRIWDAIGALPIPAGQGSEVRAVAFRPPLEETTEPDDGQMASGGTDSTVKLWNPETGATVQQLGHPIDDLQDSINTLAYSPDGKWLVTGSVLGNLELWDLSALPKDQPVVSDNFALSARAKDGARISSVAFTPDGETIATGQWDGHVQLWDARTLQPKQRAKKLPYQVWSVAVSPSGDYIASGSGDAVDSDSDSPHEIQLLTAANMAREHEPLRGPSESIIYSLSFAGGGDVIASGSADGTIQLWNVENREPTGPPLSGDQNTVMSLSFAHNGPLLVSGSADGKVRLWNTSSRQLVGTPITGHRKWVHGVAFSPQDDWIVSGGADGAVRLWPVIQDVTSAICGRIGAAMDEARWDSMVANGRILNKIAVPYENLCQSGSDEN